MRCKRNGASIGDSLLPQKKSCWLTSNLLSRNASKQKNSMYQKIWIKLSYQTTWYCTKAPCVIEICSWDFAKLGRSRQNDFHQLLLEFAKKSIQKFDKSLWKDSIKFGRSHLDFCLNLAEVWRNFYGRVWQLKTQTTIWPKFRPNFIIFTLAHLMEFFNESFIRESSY